MSATEKQIAFAKAIAKELNIELPDNDFQKMRDFISKNRNDYNKSITLKRINCLSKKDGIYGWSPTEISFIECFGVEFAEYVCNTLYNVSGIYAFVFNQKIIYIGKSINLGDRIVTSFGERIKEHPIDDIYYYEISNKADVNIMEVILIEENKPILNRDCKTTDYPAIFKSELDIFEDFKILKKGADHGASF